MYQTYQTPLSWDTPTWPPPEPLIDISLDQDTDMATASPASPLPEVYTPLNHVQPNPPASVPIVVADPPIPIPTITPDPPPPSEAYQLLDRLFPAPPDLPEHPYNPMWKPLKPDWNRLLGPSMISAPVIPASRPPSPHPDEPLPRHQKAFFHYRSIPGSRTPSPPTSGETSLGSTLPSTQENPPPVDAARLKVLATLCSLLTNAPLTRYDTKYDLD